MKFYETTAEEYIGSKDIINLHPEWSPELFPKTLRTFANMIVYGPSGSGKYSQVLSILKQYSPSELKYEKKMTFQSEKQTYIFFISDIHYEIDMSFLGCNSKTVWHELFFQIVDIISVKPDKIGILVCKNFHMIHSELLEIFYSYMQRLTCVTVKFVILTEHISFLPNNILRACSIIPIKKPSQKNIIQMVEKIERTKKQTNQTETFIKRITGKKQKQTSTTIQLLKKTDVSLLLNLKEVQSFSLIKSQEEIPKDVFNVICDQIIQDMENIDSLSFTNFRDSLYDIMIYNLDVVECVWYIFTHFIQIGKFNKEDISKVLEKIYPFLQYFNNNYRPIYHLEKMMFTMIEILNNAKNDRGRGVHNT
jgi:hypothetical protein